MSYVVEFKDTVNKLDYQISQTKKYKAKAKSTKSNQRKIYGKHLLQKQEIKVAIEDPKNVMKNVGRPFDLSMNDTMKQRFTTCVNTYQAVPILKKAERGESLPSFSEWLSKENKYTKGWYVIFCDPSLP